MALFWLFVLTSILVVALAVAPVRRYQFNRRLARQPLPATWRQWLQDRWWLYAYLPVDVRSRLEAQLQVMLANTRFYGCNGLSVTEPMQVLTLAQAALLNAGPGRMQWSGFPAVLLYPEAFVREGETTDELGLVSYERHELLGESWEQGKVVLSWADIEQDLYQGDGHCLVIHEYAHQIDGHDGVMDGTPLLPDRQAQQKWSQSLQSAYEDLQARLTSCQDEHLIPLDPYAATAPEEFFAVVCEAFFTDPDPLCRAYPDVYQELVQFFRLDPRRWFDGSFLAPANTTVRLPTKQMASKVR